MGIVDHIKAICMQHGTTIPRLERVLGFGNGTIYNWARSSPSIDKVQKVADHFSVSVDRILYGFERSQFEQMVKLIMNRRTFEQFAQDTGIDPGDLTKILRGKTNGRPPLEIVRRIAASNPFRTVVEDEALFLAAGYTEEEAGEYQRRQQERLHELTGRFAAAGFAVRMKQEEYDERICIEHPNHGIVAEMFLHAFIEHGDRTLEELRSTYGQDQDQDDIITIAAHHDGEDWTEEELEEIEQFKQFVRMRRRQRGKE